MRTLRFWLISIICSVGSSGAAQAPETGVATALHKVRPSEPVPPATEARIEAARNELEAFQIVIGGGASGVRGIRASATELVGAGGARIAVDRVVLYRVALYRVATPSNTEGATGAWPDPLVPSVDTYVGETRNAFPFDVPAGESRAIWVEVYVPEDAQPGDYTGTVRIEADGLDAVEVPVTLRVRGFALPSTSSLPSAFGIGWSDACRAHLGSYEACGDAGVERFNTLYARAALDHRVSLESVVYAPPADEGDWAHFDEVYGPLLDGTAPTRLPGARLTTLRVVARNGDQMRAWRAHFDARGWGEVLFDYTCDEPPAGCAFSDIASRGADARAAGIPTLVTTNIAEVNERGLADVIDIVTPVVNHVHDKGEPNRRADYDAFLGRSGQKDLWWYQSCMSHGCGGGCPATTDSYFTGWPSYMVDVSGVQNRAMEWLSFLYDVRGELYFQTTIHLPSAWDDVCDFSGNGDGTLFYPGTPARIGGTSHIPIESIRLKLIREGMEDYEYLVLLASLGEGEHARRIAAELFPAPYRASEATIEDLYRARAQIADRIEALSGTAGRPDAGAPPVDPIAPGVDAGSRPSDGPSGTDRPGGGGVMTGGCSATQPGGSPLFALLLALGALAIRRRC